VKKVIRLATSNKSDLEFVYDAMGNRVSKTEKMRNGSGLTGESKTTQALCRNKVTGIDEVILCANKAKNTGIAGLRRGFLTQLACKRTSQNS
jgi:hypothetical protein